MEFWGVEVKPGEPLKVKPEVSMLIHISQAAMGEVKNGKGPKKVHLRMKIDDKMYVIGTLSAEERPQILFDLVLHKEFELSHDWKDGSIYLAGYVADDESYGEDFSDEEEEDEMQVDTPQNGKLELEKPATTNTAPVKSKPSEKSLPKNAKLTNDKAASDEDEDEEDSDVGEDSDDDEEIELGKDSVAILKHLVAGHVGSDEDESEDEDEDEDDSEDDVPDLVSKNKKRPSATTTQSPVPAAKKAKFASPNKPGGKTTTPNAKPKGQNPKFGGQISAKGNSKTFNTSNDKFSKAKRARK